MEEANLDFSKLDAELLLDLTVLASELLLICLKLASETHFSLSGGIELLTKGRQLTSHGIALLDRRIAFVPESAKRLMCVLVRTLHLVTFSIQQSHDLDGILSDTNELVAHSIRKGCGHTRLSNQGLLH